MTKSKGRASAKPRSGTKNRSKVKRSNPAVHPKTRNRSKQAAVLALLSRSNGATITAIMEAVEPAAAETVRAIFARYLELGSVQALAQVAVGPASIADFGAVGLDSHARGAVFGGQLGYNWQLSPNWVLGFEGDFDGAGITGTAAAVTTSGLNGRATDGFLATERLNWLATIRGRIGYTWGNGLFYFTGGGAWENSTHNILVSTNTLFGIVSNSAAASFDTTRSGFVLGLGYEWLIAQNWTARLEYLNYDFSSNGGNGVTFAFPTCARAGGCGAIGTASERDLSVIRVGANYKF